MGIKRYGSDINYKWFVRHAYEGDKILGRINRQIMNDASIHDKNRAKLGQIINSNKFISKFELPFKYKMEKLEVASSAEKRGDMVEAYIYWRHENFGFKSALSYVEDQIIKITKEIK